MILSMMDVSLGVSGSSLSVVSISGMSMKST